jgi:hypothetical protein
MSSAAVLEVVPERAQSSPAASKLVVPKIDPAIALQKEEGHTRALLIGAFILGATMLSAMGGTLMIWAWLR